MESQMKTFAKTLLIGVLLTTSAVHAETEATTPEVKARRVDEILAARPRSWAHGLGRWL
jgi:hypothetical protein